MDLPEAEWRLLLKLAAEARAARDLSPRGALYPERAGDALATLSHPLSQHIYAPLIARIAAGPLVIAQVGQSLDGRIATAGGHSHYVNGIAALTHLHRLRALVDAVVIGASTAVLDDPQLTTRLVEGPNPVRVVLDPHRRVPRTARMFDEAAPAIAVRAAASDAMEGDGVLLLPAEHGIFGPATVLDGLAERGLRTVLIEGGGETISAFLRAERVDRLHVLLAPLLIGPGREAFKLPPLERLDAARRFRMTAQFLGDDVLLDCDLRAANESAADAYQHASTSR